MSYPTFHSFCGDPAKSNLTVSGVNGNDLSDSEVQNLVGTLNNQPSIAEVAEVLRGHDSPESKAQTLLTKYFIRAAVLGVLLLIASPLSAQTVEDKIKALQTQNAAIIAALTEQGQQLKTVVTVQAQMQADANASFALNTRMQADIVNLKENLDQVNAKLDAMASAQKVTFQTSASSGGWAGATTATVSQQTQTQTQPQVMMQMYSQPTMVRRGLFGRRAASAGACAGGT